MTIHFSSLVWPDPWIYVVEPSHDSLYIMNKSGGDFSNIHFEGKLPNLMTINFSSLPTWPHPWIGLRALHA